MPKIVVFGISKRHTRTVAHIVRAFRDRANETLWLNPAKIIRRKRTKAEDYMLEKIERFTPDIIFIYNDNIPVSVLRQVSLTNIKSVIFYEDWRTEIPQDLIERACIVDLFLVTSRGLLDHYKKAGVRNPIYFTNTCDKYDHHRRRPILPIWKSDVAFIGAARKNEPRERLVKRLQQVCNIKVYGRNWEKFNIRATLRQVYPRGYALICGGAKIMLGADITGTVEGYWSDRLWLTLGCGGFLLTNYVPGIEEIFTNRKHLVWYHDEDECIVLVKEYLEKAREREEIAEQGYRYVHEHHTFHHFVDRVLALCDQNHA